MSELPSLVGQIISGCEILEKTAEGGMGAVYRARHRALNRIVCVKILSPALSKDKKAVELFLTEARAIAELDHPNIVNVYNVGKEHGYYFIVMSFIEGQTLSAMLKKQKVIPVHTVLDLFDGVLQGLDAAHAKGIIHRDIKPSNILITPQGQAKLVDFGIAKKVEKGQTTKTSELAGTAYFIAPEQALGQNLDTRADLYSVGASLFYVLTGQFPYNGKTTIDIIQKHINEPVPDPNKLRKDLPAWLGPAIQKLMSKDPDDRFATAKETYLFFRKMRADDQLRLQSGSAGKAIDLGGDTPKMVVKSERQPTQTLHPTQRAAILKEPTQPTINTSLMPRINVGAAMPDPKPEPLQTPTPQMLNAQTVQAVPVYTGAPKNVSWFGAPLSPIDKKNLRSLGIFLPLFLLFAGLITFVFYNLGVIGSVHVSASAGLVENLIAPFIAPQYAPNQLGFTLLGGVMLLFIFLSSSIRAFSHTTTTLLCLALVSFVAGLFTPNAPMNIGNLFRYMFSPEYYLCYLLLSLSLAISICWSMNRTRPQGILGAALVIFAIGMTFASTHLTVAPDAKNAFFPMLFYGSLFCGICTAYYLVSRRHKDSIVLPCFLLLVAVGGMWIYTVSGLVAATNKTLNVLISQVDVRLTAERKDDNTDNKDNQVLSLKTTKKPSIKNIDRSNEFTGHPIEEVAAELQIRIEKAAPNLLDEQTKVLLSELLAPFYQGGRQAMKWKVWGYALAFPINNFNHKAQTNGAYFFLIIMLCLIGLVSCANTIIFREEL